MARNFSNPGRYGLTACTPRREPKWYRMLRDGITLAAAIVMLAVVFFVVLP